MVPNNSRELIVLPHRYEQKLSRTALKCCRCDHQAARQNQTEIVERWIMHDAQIFNLQELNQAIVELLDDWNQRCAKKFDDRSR